MAPPVPLVGPTLVYVASKGRVTAFRRKDGAPRWRTELRGKKAATLVLAGEHLFAASGGELLCLSASTGALLWRRRWKSGDTVLRPQRARPRKRSREDLPSSRLSPEHEAHSEALAGAAEAAGDPFLMESQPLPVDPTRAAESPREFGG